MRDHCPVGARWYAESKNGRHGEVVLVSRDPATRRECWQYRSSYRDGSGQIQDWAPTYRLAVDACKAAIGSNVTFRRVVEASTDAESLLFSEEQATLISNIITVDVAMLRKIVVESGLLKRSTVYHTSRVEITRLIMRSLHEPELVRGLLLADIAKPEWFSATQLRAYQMSSR